jgi:hypothetical protein
MKASTLHFWFWLALSAWQSLRVGWLWVLLCGESHGGYADDLYAGIAVAYGRGPGLCGYAYPVGHVRP